MKSVRQAHILSWSVGFWVVAAVVSPSSADNSFTIQGNLYRGAAQVHNETAEFQFSLWTAPAAGTQIGTTQLVSGVPVEHALFAASVDFGDVFDGTTLYLQTSVKSGDDGVFTAMAQRAAIYQVPQTQSTLAMRNGPLDPNAMVSIVGTPGNGVFSVRRNLGGPNFNEVTVNAQAGGGNAAISAQSDTGPRVLDFKFGGSTAFRVDEDFEVPGRALLVVGDGGIFLTDAPLTAEGGTSAAAAPPKGHVVGLTTHFAGVNARGGETQGVVQNFQVDYVDNNVRTPRMQIAGDTGKATFFGDMQANRVFLGATAVTTAGTAPVVELAISPDVAVVAGVPVSKLEMKVNGDVVDRWTGVGAGSTGAMTNRISGSSANEVDPGYYGCVIAGGGTGAFVERNHCTDDLGTITGGFGQTAGFGSFLGGGRGNSAGGGSSQYDVIAGGSFNTASGGNSAVSGGLQNTASGVRSSVVGGESNEASGRHATAVGGANNLAGGHSSLAGGWRAKVRDTAMVGGGDLDGDQGTFMWADSTNADFMSDGPDRFLVRARGGSTIYSDAGLTAGVTLAAGGGSWSSVSDRNLKENVAEIDKTELLQKLAAIPVTTWNYKSQDPSIRHMGPMGQDFYAAFGVGETETRLSTIDVDGVALAAIQGLYEALQDKDCRIDDVQTQNAELMRRNADLEARLAAIEALLVKSSKDASR